MIGSHSSYISDGAISLYTNFALKSAKLASLNIEMSL